MSVSTIVSVICFSIVILIGLLFAGLYLFRRKFMPYHADAVERPWSELDKEVRVLIIALMRVVGGGWLASSLAMSIFMCLFILNGDLYASVAIVITGLAVSIPTLIATLIVKQRSKANPPVLAAVLSMVLLLAGLAIVLLSRFSNAL